MTIMQLNPTIPVWSQEKGSGHAIGWIDYSQEHHLLWIISFDDTGEVWTLPNTQIRLHKNISMEREIINEIKSQENKCYNYEYIKKLFDSQKAWGLQTSIDLYECNHEAIICPDTIEKYVVELCELIEMKRYGNPIIIHFGKDTRIEGYSLVQLIETSLISGHFSNETNSAYIDIFSCKIYDPEIVCEFTKKYFTANDFNSNVWIRK